MGVVLSRYAAGASEQVVASVILRATALRIPLSRDGHGHHEFLPSSGEVGERSEAGGVVDDTPIS